MQKQVLTTGFFLLSLLFPFRVVAQEYKEIYVFGDSFSDTSNAFQSTSGAIPPSPTYFNGRFANGPVWVEYLASELGLTFNPNTNLAVGGATTGFENLGIPGLPGLQTQINGLTAASSSADPNALYIMWAGANDYFSYFFDRTPNSNNVVANLSTAVTSLAAFGAKNIMVANLPDLGKIPATVSDNQLSSTFTTFSNAHNSDLSFALDFLNQQLKDVNIFALDLDSLFDRIYKNPNKFGFTNVTDSCLGDTSLIPFGVTPEPVTCTADNFMFWDEVHPTTATHKLIGKLAFSTLKSASIPEPSVVLGLITLGVFSVASIKKKSVVSS